MLNVIVIEMKKRVSRNRDKLVYLERDAKILTKAENEKAETALLPVHELCDIQVDKVTDTLKETLVNITKTKETIKRYEADIKSLENGGAMSDTSKKILLSWYEKLKDNNECLYVATKRDIDGITKAKEQNITDSRGMYTYNGRGIAKSYYDTFIKEERELLDDIKKRLERNNKIIEYLLK